MTLGNSLDDGQAQSRALGSARPVPAGEGGKQRFAFGRVDTRPAIQDRHHQIRLRGGAGHIGTDLDARAAMVQGVVNQIADHPLHRQAAQVDLRHRFQTQPHAFFAGIQRGDHFTDDVVDVLRLGRFRAAITHERHELVENGVHVLDIADHALGQIRLGAGQQLGGQPHAGQRGAQIVGYPGQQHGTIAVGFLDVVGHLVECPIDLGDLGRAIGVQQADTLALADAPGGTLEGFQRVVELAHEHPRRCGRKHTDKPQPEHHHPDALAPQGVGIERHLQPTVTVAGLMDPE